MPSDFDLPSMHRIPDDAEWAKAAKRALRQKQRALREALPETAALARSMRIVERLSRNPRLLEARAVGLFWPITEDREVDLRVLDQRLRARNVEVYYPFMDRDENGEFATGFRRVDAVTDLVVSGRRFAEPPVSAHVATRGEVDVVIVPALAVTESGDRLGYGSGFYDATLPDLCPPAHTIVVAYDFQRLFELPLEAHDQRCNEVVTDRD